MDPAERSRVKLSSTDWLIIFVAILGFAFDIYELLMMPLIAGPALAELLDVPLGDPLIRTWVGYIFWGSAMSGGLFGLLGGWLTDRFGRRRVLVWSILVYSFSALAAGFSTSAPMLLFFRCTTFIGVCVEFVAAVAWLAELFPDPKLREKVLAYTQAFSSTGGLLVTVANVLAVKYAASLPAIYGDHSAWRYTLISGLIPAIPLMVIRPFLPESPAWERKRREGTLKRPSFAELFQPALRRTTLVTTLLFACAYGAAFGAIQMTPSQIVPGTRQVLEVRRQQAALRTQETAARERLSALPSTAPEAEQIQNQIKTLQLNQRKLNEQARQAPNKVQFYQEMGGLSGRVLLALLIVRIVSRRNLLRVFQVPGLILVPLVFLFTRSDLEMLKWGMFIAGVLTVGQFSFWGNYLPRVYPTHLRGTGESFAANVGGRMIGTSAALLTTTLAGAMPGTENFTKVAYAAALVALLVYGIGVIGSFFLPEPKEEKLPE